MKLHILCDLHVEFQDFQVPDVGADLLILAGDIHIRDNGLRWILGQQVKVPVVYVLGNHEFYHDEFPGLIGRVRCQAENTNVCVLENDVVEICGLRLFGCTLWSDMELFGDPRAAMADAAEGMNDYQLIRSSQTYRKLTPQETVTRHNESAKQLRKFLETGAPEKSIVVTHSVPSLQSIPERFRSHCLAPAFASNMERLIIQHGPSLWVHGHTHDSFDYPIGKTRIICNPRGYVPTAYNPDFNEALTVQY